MAYSLSTLANVAAKQGDYASAVRQSAQALAVLQRAGRSRSREDTLIGNGYAKALWMSHSNAQALRQIDRTLADWQRVAPTAKARRVTMLALKVEILRDLARGNEATLVAQSALALDVPASQLSATTLAVLRNPKRHRVIDDALRHPLPRVANSPQALLFDACLAATARCMRDAQHIESRTF